MITEEAKTRACLDLVNNENGLATSAKRAWRKAFTLALSGHWSRFRKEKATTNKTTIMNDNFNTGFEVVDFGKKRQPVCP